MPRLSIVSTCTLAAAIGLGGCTSSGLSYRENQNRNQAHYLTAIYADVDATQAEPQPFHRPAKVAVAQVGEVAPPQVMMERLRQQAHLFARVEAIPAVPSEPAGYVHPDDRKPQADPTRRHLHALRGMAATMGMDYLLLVGGTIDQSTDRTPASVLNLTVIGAFVVPGDETQALVKASGALIDVRTGRVISISTAEVDGTAYAPRIGGTNTRMKLLKKLRDDVTTELADHVARDCGALPAADERTG